MRLLAPVRYVCISHPEKAKYDFFIPVFVASGVWLVFVLAIPTLPLLGDDGLLKYLRDFLVMSIPFLFGALAGVAMGLPGPHFDKRPPGAELVLDGEILTLRQFVCYLLGFLTFVGLVLYISAVLADILRKPLSSALMESEIWSSVIFYCGSAMLFLAISYFFVTMLWALYFLTDIVNRPPKELN